VRADARHGSRTALHQNHFRAAVVQFLSDVVAAAAGPDHQDRFTRVGAAVDEDTGMQHLAGKLLQSGNVWDVRDAIHAGRHDDMPRAKYPLRTVRAADSRVPVVPVLIIFAGDELRTAPL